MTTHLSRAEFATKYATQALEDDYEVCRKKIDWDSIAPDVASADDVQRLKLLAGTEDEMYAPEGDLDSIFAEESADAVATATALIKVLNTRDSSKLTYVLTLLSHILLAKPQRAKVFLRLGYSAPELLKTFSRVWVRDDLSAFACGKAAICGAHVINCFDLAEAIANAKADTTHISTAETSESLPETTGFRPTEAEVREAFTSLNSWVVAAIMGSKLDHLELPMYALKAVIQNVGFQQVFVGANGLERIYDVLDKHYEHRQVTYLACIALWALSFHPTLYATHEHLLNGTLIGKLVRVVQLKTSKKVTRVVLALFENLLNRENFNEILVLFRFHLTLETMLEVMEESGSVVDLEQRASALKIMEALSHQVKVLSSVERYISELKAGKLIRGPCHTELFWKKYNAAFEEDDFKYLRMLLQLLASHDSETKAIACFDIGEWSRFYPDGNKVIAALGGKLKLMLLIEDKDADVRKAAISAVQKILIKNWQALSVGDEAKAADI